jgi:hypothetical protein
MATSATPTLNDAILDSVKQSQELFIDGFSTWADFAGKIFTPPKSFGSLPFAEVLPNPTEVVTASFDLASGLLAAQKDFAVKLLEIVEPSPA